LVPVVIKVTRSVIDVLAMRVCGGCWDEMRTMLVHITVNGERENAVSHGILVISSSDNDSVNTLSQMFAVLRSGVSVGRGTNILVQGIRVFGRYSVFTNWNFLSYANWA